ncbi:MAG: SCO family protein [Chloroflexi bacterium]|nr:SCO family protein [Chloroflexota bacterium]
MLTRLTPLLLCWTLAAVLAGCREESKLPRYGQAPDFSLSDPQTGRFASADLKGKVYLADFIYTSCTDICPLLSGRLAQVQEALKRDGLLGQKAMLVSISVDPARDTPAVLSAYAERYRTDLDGWRFLNASYEELEPLLVGFHIGTVRALRALQTDPDPIVHSNRVMLVDGDGTVRAYLPGEEMRVDDVVHEVRLLAR